MKIDRNKKGLFVLVAVCALIIVITCVIFAERLQYSLNNITRDSVQNIGDQNRIMVNTIIKSEMNYLKEVSNRLNAIYGGIEKREALEDLLTTSKNHNFLRMGYIKADGEMWVSDGIKRPYDVQRDWFRRSLTGEDVISEPFYDTAKECYVVVLSTPLYKSGEVVGVLYGTYSLATVSAMLNPNEGEALGETYIILGDGTILLSSREVFGHNSGKNAFVDLMNASDKKIVDVKENMAGGKSGFYYDLYGSNIIVYYTPLDVGGWYLLNEVSYNQITRHQRMIGILAVLVGAELVVVFVILARLILHMKKTQNDELYRLVYVDKVTGMPSYQRFIEKLAEIDLKEFGPAVIVELDIDHFKLVNDSYGYDMGNQVLCHVANVLMRFTKKGEIFARSSADHFVAFLHWNGKEEMDARMKLLYADITHHQLPIELLPLNPTAGICMYDGSEEAGIVRNNAKIARDSVKHMEIHWYAYYTEGMRKNFEEEKMVRAKIQDSLRKNEFVPFFQPKYDAQSQTLHGAEALVRCLTEDGRIVPPGAFIGVAEKSDQITLIDRMIFRKVCAQLKEWLEMGYQLVPVSVNVSRKQFYEPDFAKTYHDILMQYELDAKYIQLEITESVAFADKKVLLPILQKLQEYGFKLLIDDFGTGYSSLTILNELPIDGIKLDKGFIDHAESWGGRETLFSVMELAKKLDIELTAEGVETKQQFELLLERGCDLIQGYYFGKPMSCADFENDCLKKANGIVA